eukprot:scaffold59814_cov56-Phaeocystis_antarctica.AAC.2
MPSVRLSAVRVGVQPAAELQHLQRHAHVLHVQRALLPVPCSQPAVEPSSARCVCRDRLPPPALPARTLPSIVCPPCDSRQGANSLSNANKLLIRCAWKGTSAFNSYARYGSSWPSGSCPSPPSQSPPLASPPAPPCTYTLMSDALPWADADAACQAAGLQLASVQSAAQNALLLTAAAGNKVWIGGTDAASEGTWVWSPSNTPLSYFNWNLASDEPNNKAGVEDCLSFSFHDKTGTWNDFPCTAAQKYVCQTACPVPPPSPSPPPLPIAGYVPGSNVTQHAKIDLDQKDMEAALIKAGNYTLAKQWYTLGGNSVLSKGSFRTLQGFSTGAQGKMYDNCPGCPYKHYKQFYDYYGDFDYAD